VELVNKTIQKITWRRTSRFVVHFTTCCLRSAGNLPHNCPVSHA